MTAPRLGGLLLTEYGLGFFGELRRWSLPIRGAARHDGPMLHAAALPATHETPLLRGWLHLLACVVAVPAGIVLIGAADGAMARSSVAVYMAAVVSSFGTSAAWGRRERLQDRLDRPEKNWKFEAGDLGPRSQWDDYMKAFEDVLEKTSTDDAPWYIVPADRKWYRNVAVSEIVIQTLEGLDMSYPPPEDGLDQIVIPD